MNEKIENVGDFENNADLLQARINELISKRQRILEAS